MIIEMNNGELIKIFDRYYGFYTGNQTKDLYQVYINFFGIGKNHWIPKKIIQKINENI